MESLVVSSSTTESGISSEPRDEVESLSPSGVVV